MGVISRSNSLYNFSPSIATKSNGKKRFTLNLIQANDQMELPRYPSTNIETILPRAKGKRFKSILDLKDAFWLLVLPHKYRDIFAFSVPKGRMKGHYSYNTVPQGSIISMVVFQESMDR